MLGVCNINNFLFSNLRPTAVQVHRIPRNVDTSSDTGAANSCTPYVIVQRDGRDGIPGRDGLPGSPGVAGQKGEQGPPGPQGKKSQDFSTHAYFKQPQLILHYTIDFCNSSQT